MPYGQKYMAAAHVAASATQPRTITIALGLRTGIAILSYADDLVFGITADYDAVPDVNALAADIQRAVARLAALVDVPYRRTANGTLTLVSPVNP